MKMEKVNLKSGAIQNLALPTLSNQSIGTLYVNSGTIGVEGDINFKGLPVSTSLGPGSTSLVAGDSAEGFFGEVSLISGADIASSVGLTVGSLVNNDEPWLKFYLDSKVLFVSKKPFRRGLERSHLMARNLVYGRTITIGDHQYNLRLIKGLNVSRSPYSDSGSYFDPAVTHGSEWNRLMYRVSIDNPESQIGENFADYTGEELGIKGAYDLTTIVQEEALSSHHSVFRSRSGYISYIHTGTFSGAPADRGWRPVLELIE